MTRLLLYFVSVTRKERCNMPYEPTRGTYRFIDEELEVRSRRPGSARTVGVLPRKDYNPAELARLARHQAREKARQKSRVPANTRAAIPGDYEDDLADIDGNGDVWPPPMPNVTRRYDVDNGVPLRQRRVDHYHETPLLSRRQSAEREAPEPTPRRRVQVHWFVFVGVALLLMIAGWMAFSSLGAWWQTHQDDTTFGNPRTYQIDAAVGHIDSSTSPSHFIAENLKGQIIVVEFPGGDVSKSRSYYITTIPGNDANPPVKVVFQDINHDGRLDMVIQIGDPGSTVTVFLFNNGAQFVSKL
jgi:hypothetical protein